MSKSRPGWEIYERLVARLISDQISTDLCVTPNAYIRGRITGIKRQIDVVIDARHDTDNSRRIIVNAKKKRRKVDVIDVEAFLGVMEDVDATHGYLVCPTGYTRAAERRAQEAVSITVVPLEHLQNFDPTSWPTCRNAHCEEGRVFWDGYPEVSLKVIPAESCGEQEPKLIRYVHYVGKCDQCGQFHVQCLTCTEILAPLEDDETDVGHRCSCNTPWFWLASIERDDLGRKSGELHLCMASGQIETVDRRAL